jgi:hypothetical protein
MKVIKNFSGDADYGVLPYIQPEFDRLSDENSNDLFLNGVQFIDAPYMLGQYEETGRKALLAHWSPCEFLLQPNHYYLDAYEHFTEVYCVCPFTCDFMNKYYGYEKFIYIPYPYTNTSVNDFYKYDSTACWFGSINGDEHAQMIDTIKKFPYKYITSQQNTWLHHPYEYEACTHVNLSTADKLKEVSKSKASITINKLFRTPSNNYNPGVNGIDLKIFDYYENEKILPQFKVRTHEIASCKSLILCKKDPWNLIEDFYDEGKHFIYFDNFAQLEEILHDVENNIEKYIPIIDAAYEQVQKYSVENIFNFIKTKDNTLINWKNKNYGIL